MGVLYKSYGDNALSLWFMKNDCQDDISDLLLMVNRISKDTVGA